MTIKWKLFGVANYIMLLVFSFLLWMMFRFAVEEVPSEQKLGPLLPLMISFFIIILNSIFNLYIFHFHLPAKPLVRKKHLYIISAVLYIISLLIILFSIAKEFIYDVSNPSGIDNATYLTLGFTIIIFIIGLFVVANQFLIRKYIDKKHKLSLNEQANHIEA